MCSVCFKQPYFCSALNASQRGWNKCQKKKKKKSNPGDHYAVPNDVSLVPSRPFYSDTSWLTARVSVFFISSSLVLLFFFLIKYSKHFFLNTIVFCNWLLHDKWLNWLYSQFIHVFIHIFLKKNPKCNLSHSKTFKMVVRFFFSFFVNLYLNSNSLLSWKVWKRVGFTQNEGWLSG